MNVSWLISADTYLEGLRKTQKTNVHQLADIGNGKSETIISLLRSGNTNSSTSTLSNIFMSKAWRTKHNYRMTISSKIKELEYKYLVISWGRNKTHDFVKLGFICVRAFPNSYSVISVFWFILVHSQYPRLGVHSRMVVKTVSWNNCKHVVTVKSTYTTVPECGWSWTAAEMTSVSVVIETENIKKKM
jgi:hypothetical protein